MDTIMLKVSDGSEMQAYAARPAAAPIKGIIVLQEVFGITDFMRHATERFAPQGFLAITPEIFHRTAAPGTILDSTDFTKVAPHLENLTQADQLADITACFDWLVAEGVPKDKIAVVGFCAGGANAFMANAALPLAASVSFYGGSIAAKHFDKAKDLHASQLLIWGGKDAHIPVESRRAVVDALIAAGKPYADITFGEADHAFMRDIDPSHYHEASAKEAWALVDAFLANHLI